MMRIPGSVTQVKPSRISRQAFARLAAERRERQVFFAETIPGVGWLKQDCEKLVLEAEAGAYDPVVGSHLRTEQDQALVDSLCCEDLGGGHWCKLEPGHDGPHTDDWSEAADRL